MSQEPEKPVRRSGRSPIRPAIPLPRPQTHSGTVPRRALRPVRSEPPWSSWLLLLAAAAMATIAVAWVLGAGDSGRTASVAGSPGTTEAVVLEPTLEPTAQPTTDPTPEPTAQPTTEPTAEPAGPPEATEGPPIRLVIDAPEDGQVVGAPVVEVVGRAPSDAPITRDIPFWFDDHTVAGPSGFWSMQVSLSPGENELRFRIGDEATTARTIHVIYAPPG